MNKGNGLKVQTMNYGDYPKHCLSCIRYVVSYQHIYRCNLKAAHPSFHSFVARLAI
jgi:hypothetical protein